MPISVQQPATPHQLEDRVADADGAGGGVVEAHSHPDLGVSPAHAIGQRLVIAKCSTGMDSITIGIFILGYGVLAGSAKRALEAASATDEQTISMPTPTGKRTAKLRTTLTKRVIDGLQPTDKSWIAWDDRLTGFGVRIHRGGTKSFIVNYRAGDGGRKAPNKRVTIGRYGRVTVDQGRKLAQNLLGQIAGGGDPAYERAMARTTPSLGDGADVVSSAKKRPEEETATTPRTKYLNTREAAEYLGLSTRTMGRYRVTGDGPPFYRFGGCVRYLRTELEEWTAGRRRTSTSDDGPG